MVCSETVDGLNVKPTVHISFNDALVYVDTFFPIQTLVDHTCSKKIVCFCLPFTGHHGLHYIRSQLSKVLASAYAHISIRVVFRPPCRLSSFFPFKDRIPIALRSYVVYQFTCQCCSALYIGQTRRHIHTRISEHMAVSPLTGKERSISTMSSILAHNTCTNTQSPLLISKSYHQALLSRVFLSVKAINFST